MRNAITFIAVIATFTLGTSAVVWTAMRSERNAAQRAFSELHAAEAMVTAAVARESALRGYAQTRRASFLEAYDEGTADLATAVDSARRQAAGDPNELWVIEQQRRLATRWAGSANDAIIKVRNGDEVAVETTLLRSELITRFSRHNDELRGLVQRRAEASHRGAVERAVVLVVLLSVAFAIVGGLLALWMRRGDDARRASERAEHERQREFAETLQVTESETEAHTLVKRHLERSVAQSHVLVLNRNNSQNRLEASTSVELDAVIAGKLPDAVPGSCLAVRLGRTYGHSPDHTPLLSCELCAHAARSTCVPSLVGGEVIGSVLVNHAEELTDEESKRISQSVSQAAPVLANLRNLAVAEVRAATDALTGLPNARSLRESLLRMVAQAGRSRLPLSAVLCDLDHFKQINDVYGHEKGDQALAAASAALRSALRESDLAGRYGGEEFLILLPDTPRTGAVVLAEKLREQVALVDVPGVDRALTASFGVATFPEDTPDGDMLIRMADRALYAAKALGRNCVVTSAELLVETTA